MSLLRDKTAIVGIGHTEYSRDSGRSELTLACEAIGAAIADAGLTPADIDGITKYTMDNNDPIDIARNLGIPELRFAGEVNYGGGGGPVGTILMAAMAVATGQAKAVVAFRAMNERSGRGTPRFGQASAAEGASGLHSYQAPYGLFSPAQSVALAARRHMHLYGTESRHFGEIAVTCRHHANLNPNAMMYGRPMSIDDHQNSRMIASPLHLLDCCLETDGGAALVITTADRARDLKHPPTYISGIGFGAGHWNHRSIVKDMDSVHSESTVIAKHVFRDAGITHQDIDVLFIYDHFTPLVLMAIEDYGFCKRGEGKDFVSNGRLRWPDGDLPMNTSGGNLSEGYMHGMQNTIEAVRQLRGVARCQVKNARHAFVSAGNAVPTSAMILRGSL
ncbi:MAG: lipid-transfer protein [Gammaproteobacteria bacterium]|nr:lipid-transfer protein [Gammaproteobacteria bacterium]